MLDEPGHFTGSAVSKPPWGYVTADDHRARTLVPTEECRIWVPRIFAWVAQGHSCTWVAEQLDRHGVKSSANDGRWRESSIVKMIHRTTYSGLVRIRNQPDPLEVEGVIPPQLQERAIAALAARAKGAPNGSGEPKALLIKLVCGHPQCPGAGTWPMYRMKNRHGVYYYRCAGRGPQRRGCGAPLVRTDALDALVLSFAHWSVADGTILRSLDLDGQRVWLAQRNIKAWKEAAEVGEAIHVTVDGLSTQDRSVIGADQDNLS